MIAVLLPSRGIISSRLLDQLDQQLILIPHCFFRSHELGLPASHELLVEQGMDAGCEWFWFVEEDVVPPDKALSIMLKRNQPITSISYLLHAAPVLSFNCLGTQVCWISLGCTLIQRRVFEQLARPWFRCDRSMTAIFHQGKWTLGIRDRQESYGGLDVFFSYQAIQAGYQLDVIPDLVANHLQLDQIRKEQCATC